MSEFGPETDLIQALELIHQKLVEIRDRLPAPRYQETARGDEVRYGRRKPYTAAGIVRLKCARCGKPAHAQWSCCALGLHIPICRTCDVELNRMVLRWLRHWRADEIAAEYEQMVTRQDPLNAKRTRAERTGR